MSVSNQVFCKAKYSLIFSAHKWYSQYIKGKLSELWLQEILRIPISQRIQSRLKLSLNVGLIGVNSYNRHSLNPLMRVQPTENFALCKLNSKQLLGGHGCIFAFVFLQPKVLYKALYTKILKILKAIIQLIFFLFILLKFLLELGLFFVQKKDLYGILSGTIICIFIILFILLL